MTTVKEIIERANTKVNGEYEPMNESSDDFRTYLSVLNQCIEQWADTPYVKWQSLYDTSYTLPDPVVGGRLSYPVPNVSHIEVGNTPYDNVFFLDADDLVVERFKLTDQAVFESTQSEQVCALLGNELRLKSTPDNIIGTTIRLPAYVKPDPYVNGSQEVSIDSVTWLITAMAAFIADSSPVPFIARNAEKYYKQADIYMKTMRDNNRHKQHLVLKSPNQAPRPNTAIEALSGDFGLDSWISR